jgi:hypothetical protein
VYAAVRALGAGLSMEIYLTRLEIAMASATAVHSHVSECSDIWCLIISDPSEQDSTSLASLARPGHHNHVDWCPLPWAVFWDVYVFILLIGVFKDIS